MNEILPVVSVIVPVFQVSEYVERCILSIMAQTYRGRMECIIVNDATRDDSIEKCEKLIQQYRGNIEFRIVCHQVNRGLSAARNTGTDMAGGEYLYYIDSNDEITPDCIEKLMSFVLKDDTVYMVQGNYIEISGKQVKSGSCVSLQLESNEDVRYRFFQQRSLPVFVWNKLLRRDFVIDHNLYCKEGLINEDILWSFNLFKYLSKAQLCGDVTYHYLTRPGSIFTSSKPRENGLSFCVIYGEILADNLTGEHEREELSRYLYNFINCYIAYRKSTPELSSVYRLYRKNAKKYGCNYVFFLLSTVCPLYRLPFMKWFLYESNKFRHFLSTCRSHSFRYR